jgi:NADPH-dependent curcumin reductase CurA
MSDTTAREVHLRSRPDGWPTVDNFELVEAPVPELAGDHVRVRNTFLSVDPYMRGRMNNARSYAEPFALGEVMYGGAVGVVEESNSPKLAVGDTVAHQHGWREVALGPARSFAKIDTALAPASAFLGVLGMPGLTAYVGLLDVAAMAPGDTVFVSGAAGAVGSMVGQIAKLRAAKRVIGSAGSAEKVAYLRDELGFDAAFNYKDGPVAGQLAAAAPEGIDVFFDNVGADHLDAALGAINLHGRMALCGAIAMYNATGPAPGPSNLFTLVGKRVSMRGFIVSDHSDRHPAFIAEVSSWLRDGRLSFRETFVDGIENMPEAFIGLLRGDNTGKMVVRLG